MSQRTIWTAVAGRSDDTALGKFALQSEGAVPRVRDFRRSPKWIDVFR